MAKTKKVVEQAAPVTAPTTPTQENAVEPVQLNIVDLQALARIVDLASRRGAFQASELADVGTAYNKITGFLAYVETMQKNDAAKEEQPADQTV